MYKAPPRFELGISCLLDRRFNQLSHGALSAGGSMSVHLILVEAKWETHQKEWLPNVGLEPTTLRLRVSCSTD